MLVFQHASTLEADLSLTFREQCSYISMLRINHNLRCSFCIDGATDDVWQRADSVNGWLVYGIVYSLHSE